MHLGSAWKILPVRKTPTIPASFSFSSSSFYICAKFSGSENVSRTIKLIASSDTASKSSLRDSVCLLHRLQYHCFDLWRSLCHLLVAIGLGIINAHSVFIVNPMNSLWETTKQVTSEALKPLKSISFEHVSSRKSFVKTWQFQNMTWYFPIILKAFSNCRPDQSVIHTDDMRSPISTTVWIS